jgi:hypothetical protein
LLFRPLHSLLSMTVRRLQGNGSLFPNNRRLHKNDKKLSNINGTEKSTFLAWIFQSLEWVKGCKIAVEIKIASIRQ